MLKELNQYYFLLNERTRAELIAEIRRQKEKHAGEWLKQFKKEFPDFYFFIDLAANYNEDQALQKCKEHLAQAIKEADISEIQNYFKHIPIIRFVSDDFIRNVAAGEAIAMCDENELLLRQIHRQLRAEIDKPRF